MPVDTAVVLLYQIKDMQTKKTIAVIGATGNMGKAISKALSKGNDRLLLFSRNEEQLHILGNEIRQEYPAADFETIQCAFEASWQADIIILAVPYEAEAEIAEKIKQVAGQKIVISISNPLNTTYDGLLTAADTSAAEELQKLLPDSKVIKAFNTTYAADFLQPVIDGKQVDAFVAGNHEAALEAVAELVGTAGFNPVIAGNLSVSRTLENMQLLMIQLTIRNQYNWQAGWKILHN